MRYIISLLLLFFILLPLNILRRFVDNGKFSKKFHKTSSVWDQKFFD